MRRRNSVVSIPSIPDLPSAQSQQSASVDENTQNPPLQTPLFSTAYSHAENPLQSSSPQPTSPPDDTLPQQSQAPIILNQSKKRPHPLSPSTTPSPVQEPSNEDPPTARGATGAPKEIIDSLRGFLLFKSAPESFLEEIASKLVMQLHSAHSFIITEGEEARAMYWIIRGSVGIVSRDGESVHAELGPGAFFGEIGILFDCPRTASVQAREKCVLAVLTAGALNEVLPSYPVIEQAIRDEAQERLAVLEKNRLAQHTKHLDNQRNALNTASENSDLQLGKEYNSTRTRNHSIGDLIKYLEHTGVREILEEMPLFNKLPTEMLHKLGLAIEPKAYGPFQMIIRQNTPGKDIYFIIDGQVEVLDETSNTVIARLSRGAYFGEMAFLAWADKRTASVRTITECDCLVVTEETLVSLCQNYPEFQTHMEETANLRIGDNQSHHIWKPDSVPRSKYLSRRHSVSTSSSESLSSGQETEPKEAPGKHLDHDPFQVKKSSEDEDDQHESQAHGVGLFSKSWNTSGSFGSPSPGKLPGCELGPRESDNSLSPSDLSPASESSNDPLQKDTSFSVPSPNSMQMSKRNSPFFGNYSPSPTASPAPSRRASTKTFSLFPGRAETIIEEDETGGFAPEAPSESPTPSAIGVRRRLSHHGLLLHPRAKRVRQMSRRRSSLFTIGPFPDFIQMKIFKFMDLKTLMKVQRVCQYWRQMLQTSQQLVQELDLKPYNTTITDQTIISITNFAGIRPKKVDISNCFHLTDEGFSYLVNGIGLAKIQVFKMRSVWEVSAMAILDLCVPSIGSDLEEIDLSNCRKVHDETLSRLVGWVVPPYGPDGQPNISPSPGTVVGCAKLRKISLSYCKHITDRSMYHMAMFASDRIEYLDLTRCTTITDHGFSFWSMRSFSSLRYLCLADCTFLTDKAIISIASAAKGLQTLILSFCCALTDVSVEVLALGCPALVNLDLAFCGSAVSDASLSTIALHLLELQTLSVRGCVRVTRRGVETILMIAGSHSLRMLDITQCRNTQGPVPIQPPLDMVTGTPRVKIKQ